MMNVTAYSANRSQFSLGYSLSIAVHMTLKS